jgi:hypothetical protein
VAGISTQRVEWVLDADIQGFFDNLDQEWLQRFLEHEIADRRMLRLIQKWLKAGVSEDGEWSETNVGTPQGAVISPFLANVYLHYVFDLWVQSWRKRAAAGRVIVVRYADDFVLGFEQRTDAERFLEALRERLAKFGLELHSGKTRLIEFGRRAIADRGKRGEGKPETFDFLGFTHICEIERQAEAGETAGHQTAVEAADACAGARDRGVAAVGGVGLFSLSRRTGKLSCAGGLSTGGVVAVAANAAPQEPEEPPELAALLRAGTSLLASASYLSPVSEHAVCGHASEVGAV